MRNRENLKMRKIFEVKIIAKNVIYLHFVCILALFLSLYNDLT